MLLIGNYHYADPTKLGGGAYIQTLTRFEVVFFSIYEILEQYVFMELIILVPVIIPWINNRLKHIVVGFGIYYLYGLYARYFQINGNDCAWALLGLMWIAALFSRDYILNIQSRKMSGILSKNHVQLKV